MQSGIPEEFGRRSPPRASVLLQVTSHSTTRTPMKRWCSRLLARRHSETSSACGHAVMFVQLGLPYWASLRTAAK